MRTRARYFIFIVFFLTLLNLLADEPKTVAKELKGAKAARFLKERTKTEVDEIANGKCISVNIQNSWDRLRIIDSVQLFLVAPGGKKDVKTDVFQWVQGSRSDGDVNVLFNITDREVAISYLVFREKKFEDATLKSSIDILTTIRLKTILAATEAAKKS